MRKINTHDFRVATRTTGRDINRRIALNLVREHQPISRADLARRMKLTRGMVSVLVAELLEQEVIYEGATGEAARGRKPTFLYVRTRDRLVVSIDLRASKSYIMLCDFEGRQIALESFRPVTAPENLVRELADRVRRMLASNNAAADCEGIGVVIPGMVDHRSGTILNAPALGWRGINIRGALAEAVGLPVQVENSGRACALAQLWLQRGAGAGAHSFVNINVADGVGVGLIVRGELVRGRDDIAGEFAHVTLSLDGPLCMCGSRGCWEAYISNIATLNRYFGRNLFEVSPKDMLAREFEAFTIEDLLARARAGDAKAVDAIQETARYLGTGLANVIHAANPECVYISGEITAAWDLMAGSVRAAVAERALTPSAAQTPIHVTSYLEYPRLRGAAALIAAPGYAAPQVA